MSRCPTCDSPNPRLHPSVQFEGETSICGDSFHSYIKSLHESSGKAYDPDRCPQHGPGWPCIPPRCGDLDGKHVTPHRGCILR